MPTAPYKKIAAITMARNDEFYLRKWAAYYGAQLGRENLYIYLDGLDQGVGYYFEDIHVETVDKIGTAVRKHDKGRAGFLSDRAAELLASGYDLVIGTDADEFLVVDPALGKGLAQYLSELDIRTSVSALGLDFGQKLDEESVIDPLKPWLDQRSYAQIGTRYTKASVIARPVRWGSGFHRIKGHNYHIAKDLYLFHFGYFDATHIRKRFADRDRMSQGWNNHIEKRSRTIRLVSDLPARDFDKWIPVARTLQTVCRPPYALNKPAMLELKIVVKLPERFKGMF